MYAFLDRLRFVLMVSVGRHELLNSQNDSSSPCEATVKVCPPSSEHSRELNTQVKHSKPEFENVADILSCCGLD